MTKLLKWVGVVCSALALAACGGGGGSSGSSAFGSGSGSGSGGGSGTNGTTLAPVLALSVQLLDASGKATTSLNAGQPLRAQAVLTKDGEALVGEIVSFSLDQPTELAKIDPTSGAVLSADQGVATVNLSSLGTAAGAGRLVATAVVGGVNATAAANFFASGSSSTTSPTTLTLSGVDISSASVSAYGTTGLKARVLQNGTPFTSPVTVNFSTSCAAGKASITQSATTQPDGYAVATFVDNGCAPVADTTVTVTASISTDSKSASFVVRSPTAGSLRFLSVVPSDKSITLKGQGGNGRQENAQVTFKLVDVAGNGVSDAEVCFDSTTYIGGLNLDGFSPTALPVAQGGTGLCGSDPISQIKYVKRTNPDGTVVVQINSGTVPTPVRVRARTLYPAAATTALETYSDTLSVSTGLPIQRSFSLSVDKANIDGGDFDGEVSTITMRLADQFSNPVPDGTVVNFIASGAAVCTANNGSCKTTNGACSCNLVSQAYRPKDRRVVVTAYAVGLEDFQDKNGDNVYTPNVDTFTDLGDAYVDANKDGKFTTDSVTGSVSAVNGDADIPIPYQLNNQFKSTGDGVRGTAHLRASTIIYLSTSTASGDSTVVIPNSSLNQSRNLATGALSPTRYVRLKPTCPQNAPVPQAAIFMALEDGLGNPMAAGTTLSVVDSTDNIAPAAPRPSVVLALGARGPIPSIDSNNVPKLQPWLPADARGNVVTGHSIAVKGVTDKCAGSATFALELQSPRGPKASSRVLYEGEARGANRFGFDVLYIDQLSFNFPATATAGAVLTLAPDTWSAVVASSLASYSISWGDGTATSGGTVVGNSIAAQTHAFASAGTYTVTLTVTDDVGVTYSQSKTINVN